MFLQKVLLYLRRRKGDSARNCPSKLDLGGKLYCLEFRIGDKPDRQVEEDEEMIREIVTITPEENRRIQRETKAIQADWRLRNLPYHQLNYVERRERWRQMWWWQRWRVRRAEKKRRKAHNDFLNMRFGSA